MTVEEELARKTLALEGAVRGRFDGKFASSAEIQRQIGSIPRVEYVESSTVKRNLREISAKTGRNAVNSLYKNQLSKQGKAFGSFVKNLPKGTLDNLTHLPGRVALNTIEANNAVGKLEAKKKYIELTMNYVNQHAGGIIGDAIKEEYFQAGRMKWEPLNPETVKRKVARNKKFGGRYPRPHIPLFGTTYTAGLPDNWLLYTYKLNDFPNRSPSALPHYGISTYMVAPGQSATAGVRSSAGFFSQPYKMKSLGKETGKTAYPPEMRGAALMDVVAHLAPVAMVTRPYAGRGYQAALKAAAANPDTARSASMKVDGIIQPFYITPYVFFHETGTNTMPKRSFIETGLGVGMGRVEQLIHVYIEEGAKAFRKAYAQTDFEGIRDLDEISAYYRNQSDKAGDAARVAKVRGRAGTRKEPRVSLIDHQFDNILHKHKQIKGIIRRLFGNHLVWWFVPPSKYWHYIGMASDIRGLLFGQKNMGAAKAYVQAMSVGIAGARMGSPVPFTRKARRRKFRKGLYTRAGYHRATVGGS
tara:strand:+ start:8034 stop:9620 length:1587 start_codon:yes stop_codon:yes gene_type:complete